VLDGASLQNKRKSKIVDVDLLLDDDELEEAVTEATAKAMVTEKLNVTRAETNAAVKKIDVKKKGNEEDVVEEDDEDECDDEEEGEEEEEVKIVTFPDVEEELTAIISLAAKKAKSEAKSA
ncbi:hypothetical protein ACTXT7_017137, partial [Hymenolepis weldensis]